jgi:hypothetical protein
MKYDRVPILFRFVARHLALLVVLFVAAFGISYAQNKQCDTSNPGWPCDVAANVLSCVAQTSTVRVNVRIPMD